MRWLIDECVDAALIARLHPTHQARGAAAWLVGGGLIAVLGTAAPTSLGRVVPLVPAHPPDAPPREAWFGRSAVSASRS